MIKIFIANGKREEKLTIEKIENASFMTKPNRKGKKTILRKAKK